MTSYSEPADPAALAAALTERLDAATTRLRETVASLSDDQAREPSLLPGWTRGHLLTHLARNADSLRNLLIWARTGVETPQYPSGEARDEGISAGADRPASELAADVDVSAAQFAAEAVRLTGPNWAAEVRGLQGAPHPGWFTLRRRLNEVEIHHVDLGAGYLAADWPAEFAAELLDGVAGDFTNEESPAVTIVSTDSGRSYQLGPAGSVPDRAISGPDWLLLAWLIGRSTGDGLTAEPAGPLPPLPAW
ncbi:MAG: maleylpyruvate isomerase family mycothiol-dependent enzyme [Streptosporangiaceae bacterium]